MFAFDAHNATLGDFDFVKIADPEDLDGTRLTLVARWSDDGDLVVSAKQ